MAIHGILSCQVAAINAHVEVGRHLVEASPATLYLVSESL